MTKQEFINASKKLEAAGYQSIGAVMSTTPEMCGVDFIRGDEKFLLNKFTFNNLPV